MPTIKVEKPSWAIGIGFKHEGHERGMAIGPAWFFGPGSMYGANQAQTQDVAKENDGNQAWFTLRQVQQMAKKLGISVEEF